MWYWSKGMADGVIIYSVIKKINKTYTYKNYTKCSLLLYCVYYYLIKSHKEENLRTCADLLIVIIL